MKVYTTTGLYSNDMSVEKALEVAPPHLIVILRSSDKIYLMDPIKIPESYKKEILIPISDRLYKHKYYTKE